MKYAMTRDNYIVALSGRVRQGQTECDVLSWSSKKGGFVKAEHRTVYVDELTELTGAELKEALLVERRESEAITDAASEEFMKDFSL